MLFDEEIARIISKHIPLSLPEILDLLEIPPDTTLGDIAFPCFSLSKVMKKSPVLIAEQLAQDIKPQKPFDLVEAHGPYINFFLDKMILSQQVLTNKVSFPARKERVMVEHSNGNTHKSVHIGHLRNLFLGDSLVRILRAAGFPVVNVYYINDTGAMVAKCLWALENFHKGQKPKENKLQWLGEVYAEANAALEGNKETKKQVDKYLQKLESKDKDVMKLWKETRQWSIDDWHRIFEQLKMLPFDAKFYDSEIVKDVPSIVKRLEKKKLIRVSEGALIADFEDEGLGVVIIKKRDGTTPYIAKDLALAEKKFNEYDIDKSIYVVGSEQELHFKQLFKLLEEDGFEKAKNCYHLSYGLVMLATGKLSSREGTAPLFDNLYADVFDHALDEVKKRQEEWSEKKQKEVATGVTLAALKLPMLVQEPNKRIIFDIRKSLDFEGETGPYLQYAHARLCSVLRKHGKKVTDNVDFSVLCSDEEQNLIKLISKEHDVVVDAAEKIKPHLVARLALELAQCANTFYHAHKVLDQPDDVKKARLLLVLKTKNLLARLLELLGIPALEEM